MMKNGQTYFKNVWSFFSKLCMKDLSKPVDWFLYDESIWCKWVKQTSLNCSLNLPQQGSVQCPAGKSVLKVNSEDTLTASKSPSSNI